MTKLPHGRYNYLGFTYDEIHEPIWRDGLGHQRVKPYPNGRGRRPDGSHETTYGDSYDFEVKGDASTTMNLWEQSPPYFELGNVYMLGATFLIDNKGSYHSSRHRVAGIINPEINNDADTVIWLILPDGTLRLHPEWGRGWGIRPHFDYEIADTDFIGRHNRASTRKVLANNYEANQLELPFVAGTPIIQPSTPQIDVSEKEPSEYIENDLDGEWSGSE